VFSLVPPVFRLIPLVPQFVYTNSNTWHAIGAVRIESGYATVFAGCTRPSKQPAQNGHAEAACIAGFPVSVLPDEACSASIIRLAARLRALCAIGRIALAKKSSVSSRPAGLKSMTSEDIKKRQWTEGERQALRRAAIRQKAGDESDLDFEDVPRLTGEQLAQMVRLRSVKRKVAVSLRLDSEVLDWLKSKGEGHLTRINDILVNLMEAERRADRRQ
jgi:uncharacterized protein (DUF4415 family)